MASEIGEVQCIICEKEERAVQCEGCLQMFCRLHLNDHCQELSRELDEIESYGEKLNEKMDHPERQIFIEQIDQWQLNSIEIIQQTAEECRKQIFQQAEKYFHQIKPNFTQLIDQMKEMRREHTFNENDLNQLKQQLAQLEKDLDQIPNVTIEQDSASFIKRISVVVSPDILPFSSSRIDLNTKWKQNGLTVAGGNGQGRESYQFSCPFGIAVDDDEQCIYVTDCLNHGVVQWKYGAKCGQLVAGGNPALINIMNQPTDVIVDKLTDSLIICDWGNKRVVRWPRRNISTARTIISDIDGWGLAKDNNGDLYVSDCKKHEVRRWEQGGTAGCLVAGGNGRGAQLNQLNSPTHLFVDKEYSVYISDNDNHRVMKWMKDTKEGVVVAGGQGPGKSLSQLFHPQGVIVDPMGNVYVADSGNDRIVRWSKGSTEGQIIVGGNGKGRESNQLSGVDGLSFDRQGNIYAVDWNNYRVQKFEIDST